MGSRGGEYEREALILSRALVLLKVNWPEGPREGGLGHCDDEPPWAKQVAVRNHIPLEQKEYP